MNNDLRISIAFFVRTFQLLPVKILIFSSELQNTSMNMNKKLEVGKAQNFKIWVFDIFRYINSKSMHNFF